MDFSQMSNREIIAVLDEVSARTKDGITDLGNGYRERVCLACFGYGFRYWRWAGGGIEKRPCIYCDGRGYFIYLEDKGKSLYVMQPIPKDPRLS